MPGLMVVAAFLVGLPTGALTLFIWRQDRARERR